jgi:hypothetical protein
MANPSPRTPEAGDQTYAPSSTRAIPRIPHACGGCIPQGYRCFEVLATNVSGVVFLKTKVARPWFKATVVVRGEATVGLATVSFTGYKPLRAALEQAGFRVIERKTWFSFGGNLAR